MVRPMLFRVFLLLLSLLPCYGGGLNLMFEREKAKEESKKKKKKKKRKTLPQAKKGGK